MNQVKAPGGEGGREATISAPLQVPPASISAQLAAKFDQFLAGLARSGQGSTIIGKRKTDPPLSAKEALDFHEGEEGAIF